MSRQLISALAMVAVLVTASPSRAAEGYVKKEVSEVVTQFNESRLSDKMFQALGNLMVVAVEKLQAEGYPEVAQEISNEWVQVASLNMGQFGLLDLGDHTPLNAWLARTYDKIESKLGSRVMHWLRLDDLKVINFAIPVVFNPNGRGGDHWDMEEYRKHFVPFSGVVVYWSVSGVCRIYTPTPWSLVCSPASEISRYAVERWVAPFMSDRIYSLATGKRVDLLNLEDQDLDRLLIQAEEELKQAAVL